MKMLKIIWQDVKTNIYFRKLENYFQPKREDNNVFE